MKVEIIISVIFLSVLHGLIPSHWMPVMAMKKKYKWDYFYTLKIVSLVSVAHILSTIVLGFAFAFSGSFLADSLSQIISIKILSSLILFVLGVYFIYKHYYHHHFHLYHEDEVLKQKDVHQQVKLLIIGMLFSPCMEITGMYLVGGIFDWQYALIISWIYFIISFVSSVFWVYFFDTLSTKINFHQLEHNSGLLSGASLIISAVLVYFI
jgi:hypothetical protein